MVFIGLSILEFCLFGFEVLHDEFWPSGLFLIESMRFELRARGRVSVLSVIHSNNNCYSISISHF